LNDEDRDVVLAELNDQAGQVFPAEFFRRKRTNKTVSGPYEYHNLVRGIYKPSGCDLAITILQTLTGPYRDSLNYQTPSRWSLEYVQQGKGASGWDNLSLERCVQRAPVGVIVQESTKASRGGSRYKIWGLGRVNSYDMNTGVFSVSNWQGPAKTRRIKVPQRDLSTQEEVLRKLLAMPFRPFEETKPATLVKRRAREEAFRHLVIMIYNGKCVVCSSRWLVDGKFESQAAHIIPKSKKGTDDLRNGIALCRFHHWAFDRGIFSIEDNYTIVVSPQVANFSENPESVKALSGIRVALPETPEARASTASLEWHRNNVLIR
jgi:hypothetical protein